MKYKLPKTLRDKKRYLEVRAVCDAPLPEDDVRRAVWDGLLQFLGEAGAAKTLAWIMTWDENANKGIIRCSIPSVDEVIVALKIVREINNEPVLFVTEGVSGTIKSLRTTPLIK